MLTSIGHVQVSAMDTAQVFPESFLVWEGIWVWVATIQPDQRAEEPSMGMGHLNMAVG